MNDEVGALHEFHDPDYAQEWADRFVPTSEREEFFSTLLDGIPSPPFHPVRILELGIGPGYLAERLLARFPDAVYEGVDFSEAMLAIAHRRLQAHSERIRLTQLDLMKEDWIHLVAKPIDCLVTTWALHDLGSEEAIASVYRKTWDLLPHGGILLNGDFVKPDSTRFEYEAGRIPVSRHLELLNQAGFQQPECVEFFEEELEQPTAAQNYAYLRAQK